MVPSLKLTAKAPEMDGWNIIVSFWDGLFSGGLAVSFREGIYTLDWGDSGSICTYTLGYTRKKSTIHIGRPCKSSRPFQ